jgi:hypothetical protein
MRRMYPLPVARGERCVRSGEGGGPEDRVLKRRIRTERIGTFGYELILPFS